MIKHGRSKCIKKEKLEDKDIDNCGLGTWLNKINESAKHLMEISHHITRINRKF